MAEDLLSGVQCGAVRRQIEGRDPSGSDDRMVWPSVSRNGSQGLAISAQSIANLCDKWLGMSQVHTLRYTFVKTMEEAEAKVSDMQARLGHTSLAVMGRYLARLNQSENAHLGKLSSLYGIVGYGEDEAGEQ